MIQCIKKLIVVILAGFVPYIFALQGPHTAQEEQTQLEAALKLSQQSYQISQGEADRKSREEKRLLDLAKTISLRDPYEAVRAASLESFRKEEERRKAQQKSPARQAAVKPAPSAHKALTTQNTAIKRPASPRTSFKEDLEELVKANARALGITLSTQEIQDQIAALEKKAVARKPQDFGQALPDNVIIEKPELQQGAYCGYHSLYNGYMGLQWLSGKTSHEIYLKNIAQFRATRLESMKKTITARRTAGHEAGLNLNGSDVATGQNLNDYEIGILARESLRLPETAFTIVPNIGEFDPAAETEATIKTLATFAHQLRTQPNVAPHIFFLGTMGHVTDKFGKTSGVGGHWIAVVVYKQGGHIQYYAYDSLSNKHTINALAPRLMQLLEHDDIDQLRLASLVTPLENALNVLHNNEFRATVSQRLAGALNHITTLIGRARALLNLQNLKTNAAFNQRYRPIILELLQEIVRRDTTATQHYAARAALLTNQVR